MQLQVVVKKFGDEWRGAMVIDGKFQDTMKDKEVNGIIWSSISKIFDASFAEGTTINVDVSVTQGGK